VFSFFKSRHDVSRRIGRGVKRLERYDRQWFNQVDTETLDLGNNRLCVAAQATGSYYGIACMALGIDSGYDNGFVGWSIEDREQLRKAWVKLIRAKQDAYKASLMTALQG
jgi:hypothetical protein